MKKFILLLSIFILCSSNTISEEIFVLNFSKSNFKKFIVIKKNEQYIFKAKNKEKKDMQSCKWIVSLNKKQIKKLKTSLKLLIIDNQKESENHIYKLIRKKNEIKLLLKKSKCTAEHKLSYFQKDCNRNFVMKMKTNEFERLLNSLN